MRCEVDWTAALFSSLLICMVVVCHLYGTDFISGPFGMFPPYSWFLAGFAFVSGRLWRQRPGETFVSYCKRRIWRMIVPLLLINAAYAMIVDVMRRFFGFTFGADLSPYTLLLSPFIDCHDLGWNVPMWFIAPFCLAQCLHVFIRQASSALLVFLRRPTGSVRRIDVCSLVACLALGIAGIAQGGGGRMSPGLHLLMCRTLYFVPWLAIGRFYASFLAKRSTMGNVRFLSLLLLGQLLLLYLGDGGVGGTPSWGDFPHGVVVTILAALSGIAFWWRLCRIVAPYLSDGAKKIVAALNEGSFSIMCLHLPGAFVLSTLFGLVATATPLFGLWDLGAYLASSVYEYLPHGISQFSALYVVFSICFSLALRRTWLAGRSWVRGHTARHAAYVG